MVLERSDALKLLAMTFGLAGVMLFLISGIFCSGQDATCQIQAIGALLFNSIGGLIFGAFTLLVLVVVLLSVKPNTGRQEEDKAEASGAT